MSPLLRRVVRRLKCAGPNKSGISDGLGEKRLAVGLIRVGGEVNYAEMRSRIRRS